MRRPEAEYRSEILRSSRVGFVEQQTPEFIARYDKCVFRIEPIA